ncbi:MAG: AMP-dependent synthetase/ligase [Candidatus Acetothermia bacterium]
MFVRSVEEYPDSIIKTADPESSDGERYLKNSFSELAESVSQLSYSLRKAGISEGDKVALIGKPHPRWAATFFATQRLGAICVPIDCGLTSDEVRRILQESETKLVAIEGVSQDLVADNVDLLPHVEEVLVYSGQARGGFADWNGFIGQQTLEDGPDTPPTNTAVIMYTSGTTGDAKGVMLSHRNLVTNVVDVDTMLDIGSDDMLTSILPWHHIYGMNTNLLLPINYGASISYTEDYRNLPEVLKENEATFLLGVPKLFNAVYKEIKHEIESNMFSRILYRISPRLLSWLVKKKFAGSQFRFAVSGGAPLDPETARGFRELGLGIMEGYGLTETSPILTLTEDPFTEKTGTVGSPLPSVELKLDSANEKGVQEVLARGPNIMQGYYKNSQRTEEVLDEDGWFHTGDSGSFDEEQWLYLNGRKKNVIVLESGKNVYPEEVEWELERLPFIQEALVQEKKRSGKPVVSAVVYPDYGRLEEEGIVDEDAIKDVLWQVVKNDCQRLASYKRIKSKRDIEILEEPFEKTPTFKVKRYLYSDEKVTEV